MDVIECEEATRVVTRVCSGVRSDTPSGLISDLAMRDIEDDVYQHVLETGRTDLLHYANSEFSEDVEAAKRGLARAVAYLSLKRILEGRDAAIAQADFEKAKEDAVYFNSPEFREEVIRELIGEGATRLQAEGRTRDQARLYAEAQRLNLM